MVSNQAKQEQHKLNESIPYGQPVTLNHLQHLFENHQTVLGQPEHHKVFEENQHSTKFSNVDRENCQGSFKLPAADYFTNRVVTN